MHLNWWSSWNNFYLHVVVVRSAYNIPSVGFHWVCCCNRTILQQNNTIVKVQEKTNSNINRRHKTTRVILWLLIWKNNTTMHSYLLTFYLDLCPYAFSIYLLRLLKSSITNLSYLTFVLRHSCIFSSYDIPEPISTSLSTSCPPPKPFLPCLGYPSMLTHLYNILISTISIFWMWDILMGRYFVVNNLVHLTTTR